MNKNSLESSQQSPLPPTKPQRNLGAYQTENQGKENLFKFDLNIEKQQFKRSNNSFDEQQHGIKIEEDLEKNRKKEKKTKRQKKEKEPENAGVDFTERKPANKSSNINSPSSTIDQDMKARQEEKDNFSQIERKKTYSDEESEDFVVDDVIETVNDEDDVEIRQSKSMGVI